MKTTFVRLLSASALSLLVSTTTVTYAQQQREEPKPPEPRPEEARPSQDEMKPQPEPKPEKPAPRENKPAKEDKQAAQKNDKNENKTVKTNGQEQTNQTERQTSNRSARIPDDKFRSHFGRQHTFVVNRPTVVEGRPRFQYGGYSFVLVDAWPVGWDYADQCYIDDINGEYFLFDVLHPGVQIALVVVM